MAAAKSFAWKTSECIHKRVKLTRIERWRELFEVGDTI